VKILYHHRTLADGAEGVHIAQMVAAFRGLGHEVEVCGLAAGAAEPRRPLLHGAKRLLPDAAFELAMVPANLVEERAAVRRIRAFQPDLLYKRHARLDVGALRAARRAGVPSVLEVNCLFADERYQRFEPSAYRGLTAGMERRALQLADRVVAVSTPLVRAVERFAGVRATLLPNAADPGQFDPDRVDRAAVRERLGLADAVTIGWAGVMREWHGLELLLDAVALVPDVRLVLLGGGPAQRAVECHAAALGLADCTVITGRIEHGRMAEYLAALDIAVVAADRTGIASPMKLLEYMAMARAVVAPRIENICDLVLDGEDGLLFTPDSVDDLASVLRRLAADRELRQKLGSEARRRILNSRTWQRNADLVLKLVSRPAAARE
jgi:glycosyltransferase involved in cell wall biosynthesis